MLALLALSAALATASPITEPPTPPERVCDALSLDHDYLAQQLCADACRWGWVDAVLVWPGWLGDTIPCSKAAIKLEA